MPDNNARAPQIISVFPSERHGDDLQRGITIAAHDGTMLVLVKRTTHGRAQGRIILRIMLTLLQPFFFVSSSSALPAREIAEIVPRLQ